MLGPTLDGEEEARQTIDSGGGRSMKPSLGSARREDIHEVGVSNLDEEHLRIVARHSVMQLGLAAQIGVDLRTRRLDHDARYTHELASSLVPVDELGVARCDAGGFGQRHPLLRIE